MTVGIVILAHHHLNRTKQLARTLASRNVRVVIHVDANTDDHSFEQLRRSLSDNANIRFAERVPCDWGAFSLVKAGLSAAERLLKVWPGVSHVVQISGSCLPIRPIEELTAFLDRNTGRDFVESHCARNGTWIVDGLSVERFTLYFPFSWRRQRWLFDTSVALQRRLGIRRTIPEGLHPHVGSQWWCLSTVTLRAILNDPRRAEFDRYFKRCWIPDEGYVPTLARLHSTNLVSASLTLSRFDDQGKPHMFYDDHADLLEQSDQFFARKIWHGADGLYKRFLGTGHGKSSRRVADDLGLDMVFKDARERRCLGRKGRLSVGRFPAARHRRQPESCRDYGVFLGFSNAFEDMDKWLGAGGDGIVHGRLFLHDAVRFANVPPDILGAIPANPKVRDTNPEQFLCNLLWNGRHRHQSFLLEHCDGQRMGFFVANDDNARITMLRGSWVLELLSRAPMDRRTLRNRARRLELQERRFLEECRAAGHGQLELLTVADLVVDTDVALERLAGNLPGARAMVEGPGFRDLSGLRTMVARLQELGIAVDQLGDLPAVLPGEPARVGADALLAIG